MSAGYWVCDGQAPTTALRVLVKLATCCVGAGMGGPSKCTCWVPEYDLEQLELDRSLVAGVRDKMCDGCAFRPGSPERSGDERYDHAAPDGAVPDVDGVFWCHDGMRKPVRWRHPAGIVVEADADHYAPPVIIVDGEGIPYKADGTPGERCAGWAAHQRFEFGLVDDLVYEARKVVG